MAEEEAPKKAEKDRSERWLLTYADLITLLLIFFIILYVMGKQDAARFQAMANSLNKAFKGTGHVVGRSPGPGIRGGGRPGSGGPGSGEPTAEDVKREVQEIAKQQGLGSDVSVTVDSRGTVITLKERVLFGSGRADLSDRARTALDSIGAVLAQKPGSFIRVEGHTDNVPIAGRYPSNWELSSARAASVVRLMVSDMGIDPSHFAVAGFGDTQPVASNDSPEGRAANRRIEIVITDKAFRPAPASR